MNTYIYRNAPVDKDRVMSPIPADAKIMGEHFQYLKDKLAAGELVIAGPCTDAAFGIVVFHAESDEAARQFMDDDPAIREGLMTAELHPFRVSLLAQRPAEPQHNPYYQNPVPTAFDEFICVQLEPTPNRKELVTDEEKIWGEKIQMEHLAHLKELNEKGQSVVHGPFTDEIAGGIIILRGSSLTVQQVQIMMDDDPLVKAGRLTARVRSFVAPKDIL